MRLSLVGAQRAVAFPPAGRRCATSAPGVGPKVPAPARLGPALEAGGAMVPALGAVQILHIDKPQADG
jgi:hypothetical protein